MVPPRFVRLLLLAAAITTTPLVPITQAASSSKEADPMWDSTGSPNGRFWRNMDSTSKLTFVIGLEHGMTQAAALMSGTYERYQAVKKVLWPSLTYGEVSDALDRFYAVP